MGCETSTVRKTSSLKTNQVHIEMDVNIYHEKQSRELCALHALNNLFQDKNAFTKKELDNLCLKLAPDSYINPHRSVLGLGNYDINIIMAALQTKDCDTVWFDKRRSLNSLNLPNIIGFILNIPTDMKWGFVRLPLQRKHWVAIRKISGKYYNLDSKLDCPYIIGEEEELIAYLKEEIRNKEKELLLVTTEDVAKKHSWCYEADSKKIDDTQPEIEVNNDLNSKINVKSDSKSEIKVNSESKTESNRHDELDAESKKSEPG